VICEDKELRTTRTFAGKSAVRVTHVPTGWQATAMEERFVAPESKAGAGSAGEETGRDECATAGGRPGEALASASGFAARGSCQNHLLRYEKRRGVTFQMKPSALITLFRPVGDEELALIRERGWQAFPPRLPGQPFFYPVLNEVYATQIARDWNTKEGGSGYVLRFQIDAAFLSRYPVQTVGAAIHQEYWIPAEELADFNQHLIGPIEVVASFRAIS
jgi:hypothetical protein